MMLIAVKILLPCFMLQGAAAAPAVFAAPDIIGSIPALVRIVQAAAGDEEHAVLLEQARMLETVDRRYEQALEAYRALSALQPEAAIREKSELGAARCLMKLGRYAEAERALLAAMQGELSEETRQAAGGLLTSVQRLAANGRRESASSVDNLVWQLLDAAASPETDRAHSARYEIEKMGALAVPVIREAARDRDYFKSVAAFTSLVNIRGAASIAFMDTCAADPDTALRKRCLDGIMKSDTRVDVIPVLLRYLEDPEEALKLAALDYFAQRYPALHGKLGKYLTQAAEKIHALHSSKSIQLRDKAFDCVIAVIQRVKQHPV